MYYGIAIDYYGTVTLMRDKDSKKLAEKLEHNLNVAELILDGQQLHILREALESIEHGRHSVIVLKNAVVNAQSLLEEDA